MTEHVLKIHPQPLADLLSGAKTAEVRDCSDRDFQVGDTVRLRELTADGYTGREVTRTISHVQVGYGLPVGLCVLSYAPEDSPGFTDWMRDHGLEGMRHELGVEELMEGAFQAGAKSARVRPSAPAAWVNGEQLLLCSRSPREVKPGNPMLDGLPRNIAGSALPTSYCDTPLYRNPA